MYETSPKVKILEEELENSSIMNVEDKIPKISLENENITKDAEITQVNLLASVGDAPILEGNSTQNQEKMLNSYIFPAILFVFLFMSGGAVYFIRKNNVIPQASNEFEILDE